MALTWLAIAVMFRNLMKVIDRADITNIESKRWHIGGRRLTLTTSTGRVRIFVHRFTRPDQMDAFIEAFATPVV